jgi:hypothetical protein
VLLLCTRLLVLSTTSAKHASNLVEASIFVSCFCGSRKAPFNLSQLLNTERSHRRLSSPGLLYCFLGFGTSLPSLALEVSEHCSFVEFLRWPGQARSTHSQVALSNPFEPKLSKSGFGGCNNDAFPSGCNPIVSFGLTHYSSLEAAASLEHCSTGLIVAARSDGLPGCAGAAPFKPKAFQNAWIGKGRYLSCC